MLDLLVSRIAVDFPRDTEGLGEEWLVILAIIYAVIGLFASGFSIVTYVLHSLGLYTIAERRGIHHGWLAWVPVGNAWVLGSISDQYQYLVKGKIKNRRRVLTGLNILLYILVLVYVVSVVVAAIASFGIDTVEPGPGTIALWIASFVMMIPVAIVIAVYQYLAYYDLYSSCQPDNAVVYLVLSIVVPVAMPFLVFINRNKDGGMPPRKQPKPQREPEPQPAVISADPETEENPAEQETDACEAAPEESEDVTSAEETEPEKPVEE